MTMFKFDELDRRDIPKDAHVLVDLTAGTMINEWERVEGVLVNASYVSTYVDMAAAVLRGLGLIDGEQEQ